MNDLIRSIKAEVDNFIYSTRKYNMLLQISENYRLGLEIPYAPHVNTLSSKRFSYVMYIYLIGKNDYDEYERIGEEKVYANSFSEEYAPDMFSEKLDECLENLINEVDDSLYEECKVVTS